MEVLKDFFYQVAYYLAGKKTYIVGVLMIVIGYTQGDNKLILEGLGLITLRAGVTKSGF